MFSDLFLPSGLPVLLFSLILLIQVRNFLPLSPSFIFSFSFKNFSQSFPIQGPFQFPNPDFPFHVDHWNSFLTAYSIFIFFFSFKLVSLDLSVFILSPFPLPFVFVFPCSCTPGELLLDPAKMVHFLKFFHYLLGCIRSQLQYVGSSLRHGDLLWCTLYSCGTWAQQLQCPGLVALQHVGSQFPYQELIPYPRH